LYKQAVVNNAIPFYLVLNQLSYGIGS